MAKRNTPSIRTALQRARDEAEIARLQLETRRNKRRLEIMQKYDAVETNRLRRRAARETGDEGSIYDMTRRALGANLGRDLERNYSPARSLIHQFRVNCVGSLGKIRVNVEGGDDAADYFNSVWSKNCDFRTDMDWSTWLQNTLAGIIREGDQLTVFDDGITDDDSGKLLTWETDQIAPLQDSELLKAPDEYKGLIQDNGILRDGWGREVAYIASGKRGLSVIGNIDDATIFPRGIARLMRNPWRHNQGRGVPVMVTPAGNFVDIYEILTSELQTAKRAAKQWAYVQRSDAVTDWDDPGSAPEFLPENTGKTATEVDAEGANLATATGAKNYEKLEAFAGGFVDYIDPDDNVTIPDIKHPNKDIPAFLEAVHGFSGSALGMAAAYTRLRADTSYTAFRGDMIMSWVTFYWLQKRLERVAADWVGVRVLTWAMRKKLIKKLPDRWESKVSWTWPRMPEVDELDAQNAITAGLKNGTLDFAALLGPDWNRKLEDYAKQVDEIRRLGLPLSILEAKSGGMSNPKKDNGATQGE